MNNLMPIPDSRGKRSKLWWLLRVQGYLLLFFLVGSGMMPIMAALGIAETHWNLDRKLCGFLAAIVLAELVWPWAAELVHAWWMDRLAHAWWMDSEAEDPEETSETPFHPGDFHPLREPPDTP